MQVIPISPCDCFLYQTGLYMLCNACLGSDQLPPVFLNTVLIWLTDCVLLPHRKCMRMIVPWTMAWGLPNNRNTTLENQTWEMWPLLLCWRSSQCDAGDMCFGVWVYCIYCSWNVNNKRRCVYRNLPFPVRLSGRFVEWNIVDTESMAFPCCVWRAWGTLKNVVFSEHESLTAWS